MSQVFPLGLHQQQVSQSILHKYCLPTQVEKVAPCAKKERFMLISDYAGHKANMENLGKQFFVPSGKNLDSENFRRTVDFLDRFL